MPEVVRSDNLSAATHKLKDGKGRDFNERCKAILDHYGLKATRTNSYSAHENGVAEQGHRRLKDAVAQALVLRGSLTSSRWSSRQVRQEYRGQA